MISTTLRLAARNTLRRRVRTALTAGMVTMGVALLVLALTWVGGTMGGVLTNATGVSGHVRVVDPDYARREVLMPLEENLPAVAGLAETVRKVPGVVAVVPRITSGVTVTVGEEIGEVFGQAVGAPLSYFDAQLGLREKMAEGTFFTGAEDELLLGAKVAEQAKAKIGDEVLLLGVTQDGSMSPIKGKLVGIVKAGTVGVDQQILLPLEKLQWMTDIPEGATELLVYGEGYKLADSLAERLRSTEGLSAYAVQSWSERDPWKSLGETVRGMQSAIMMVIVFLAALGIWNTMMMSVLERTSEIGVLRALGLSRMGAVGLFVGEALAIGIAGGLLGLALGSLPAWVLTKEGLYIGAKVAEQSNIGIGERVYGDLNPEVLLVSFSLGLLMAVLGSVLPSLRAASIQPVTAMRSGR